MDPCFRRDDNSALFPHSAIASIQGRITLDMEFLRTKVKYDQIMTNSTVHIVF
jgi:hypothetical protein